MDLTWIDPDRVAGMAMPSPEDAEALRAAGVTGLVSLTRRVPFDRPPGGLSVLHLPVTDLAAPTQAQLGEAVRFIGGEVDRGGRAAVHCLMGLGRTGTVVAAWLVARGAEPEEAIHRVREARPGSVETAEQEHAVHLFAEARRRTAAPGRSAP